MSRLDDLKIGDEIPTGKGNLWIPEMTIAEMQQKAWQNAEDKGFHGVQADVATRLMLMVTELAEAMEEWRSGRKPNETWYKDPGDKPEGVPSELADVVIRIGDFCQIYGIDLEKAIIEKMAYNKTRPQLHGGKRC